MDRNAADTRALHRQIAAARRRAERSVQQEPSAVGVQYDPAERRLRVALANGAAVDVPIALLPRLAHATDADLQAVTVGAAGLGLCWEALNEDVSVAGLLQAAFGRQLLLRVAGSAGGSVRSAAKARAARRNGRKGGRPRKARSG